jgi:hypothetical protein
MPLPIDCVSADPTCWDCPTLDTDLHILNSLGEPLPLPDHIDPGNLGSLIGSLAGALNPYPLTLIQTGQTLAAGMIASLRVTAGGLLVKLGMR